ncbi:MAG: histidine kinase N-terminal 7TM domain-containing protein [Patescibacteria group bacterium]|jgi:hypothetical protein
MTAETHSIILLILAGLEFLLMFYLLSTRSRGAVVYSYSAFIFFVGIWVMSTGLFGLLKDEATGVFWSRMANYAAIMIMVVFVYFAYAYPYFLMRFSRAYKYFLTAIAAIFLALNFFTEHLTKSVVISDQINRETFGDLFWLYVAVLIALYVWAIYKIISKYRLAEGTHKNNLLILLIGFVGSGVIGIFFNAVMPLFGGTQSYFIGTEATVIWLSVTTYIVFKK